MHAYPPCVPIRNLICFLAFVHLAGAKAAGDMALLVKWKDGPASPAAAAGNARIGSTVTRNFNTLGWQQVLLPKGMSLNEGLAAYRKSGEVLAVEPDRPMTVEPPRAPKPSPARSASLASVTPNDPQYASQWYLKKIGAPTAWETATGSTNVVVAVIDSGVDYTHPDLAPNMWRNPGETGLDANGHDKATNGIDDDGDGYVDDVYGIDVLTGTGDPMDHGLPDPGGSGRVDYHGTGIAGIIGAIGNNSRGIAGLNWSIQLMAIRWDANLDSTDPQYSHATYWSVNLAAWDYVLTMKRRGVNICVTSDSYGQRGLESIAVREAIEAAGREGILSVFTGGYSMNEDLFATFPASFNLPSVINVAGSSASDTLADFGGGQTSDFGPSTVHLAAPAMNILSTTKGGGYAAFNGTSFAVPQVAATAALLLAADPRLTIDEIRAAIFGSVDQPAALKSKLLTSGRLNVGRALGYLTNGPPPAIVTYAAPAGQPTPPNAPIQVTFNRPMNRASVENAFLVTPAVAGAFEWAPDSRSFLYRHEAPLDTATNYTVRILGTAQDDTGAGLDGNFNRLREGSPADDFVWTFRFRVSNDDFTAAQPLSGTTGSIRGNNQYSWVELNEPPHVLGDYVHFADSAWYRWTAPVQVGWFTFDLTAGTGFDSLLAVYTGDQLDRLIPVAGNDNYGSRPGSRMSFASNGGTSYSLVVATRALFNIAYGAGQNGGAFTLNWYPTPSPAFTGAQFSPSSGMPGSKVTLTGTDFTGATAVLFNGASASFANAPTNNLDLRISAIVPSDATSGPITVMTPHGNVTSTATFQVLPPRLLIARTDLGRFEIRWSATSDAFVLEASDNLASGKWTIVDKLPIHESGFSKIPMTPKAVHFYRLSTR